MVRASKEPQGFSGKLVLFRVFPNVGLTKLIFFNFLKLRDDAAIAASESSSTNKIIKSFIADFNIFYIFLLTFVFTLAVKLYPHRRSVKQSKTYFMVKNRESDCYIK